MKRNLIFWALLCFFLDVAPALGGGLQSTPVKDPEPGEEEMKVIAVMDVLEILDLAENMDLMKDLDVLIEDTKDETKN